MVFQDPYRFFWQVRQQFHYVEEFEFCVLNICKCCADCPLARDTPHVLLNVSPAEHVSCLNHTKQPVQSQTATPEGMAVCGEAVVGRNNLPTLWNYTKV
jgi:hypothetical protein